MNTTCKDKVLSRLELNKGAFISGGALANELGVSRNAVWKAIHALGSEGYKIESVTGKGYRLAGDSCILSAASIQRYLSDPRIKLEYHQSIDSTNTRAKTLAEAGAPEGTLVVANEQTAGRGRQGRSFYSPADTGIYFSFVLRPSFSLDDIALITSYAAVAVAKAIDEVFAVEAQIKWVNDVFVNGHKVCGILTEAAFSAECGRVSYVIPGIGINVLEPEGGFPDEVKDVAHALSPQASDAGDLRAKLVARAADIFMEGYEDIPAKPHLAYYRKRSLLDGKKVTVYQGDEDYEATVVQVNDDFTLRVQLADGTIKDLVHGEVHIPSSQL